MLLPDWLIDKRPIRLASTRLRSASKEEIAGFAGNRLEFCIVAGLGRDLSTIYLCPRDPAIRGFVYAITHP